MRENETDLEAFERAQKEFLTFLSKHMHIFLPKELFETFSAPDFNSFIDKAVPLLNQYKDSCLINIQLIPNRDLSGATFSYYPNYIERHTPGQPSKLTYSTWELDNRVKPWNLKQGIGSSNWGAGESISPTPVSSQLGNLI